MEQLLNLVDLWLVCCRPKRFRILMCSPVCPSIHQSPIAVPPAFRITVVLESFQAVLGWRRSFTPPPPDMLPVYHRSTLRNKQPFTLAVLPSMNLEPAVCLMCSSLSRGRKLEYLAWTLAAVTNFMMYQQSREATDVELNSKVWLNMLIRCRLISAVALPCIKLINLNTLYCYE